MKLLEKNGHGEPLGERVCIEAALMLERWAHKGVVPMYSGLIDGLRKCAEEISAMNRSRGVGNGDGDKGDCAVSDYGNRAWKENE